MVLVSIAAGLLAPVVSPYGETEVISNVWLQSSSDHLLGTDHLGRDIFTRLLYGARNTIAIAFFTTILSFLTGTIMGFFAATLGLDRSCSEQNRGYSNGYPYPYFRSYGVIGGGNIHQFPYPDDCLT